MLIIRLLIDLTTMLPISQGSVFDVDESLMRIEKVGLHEGMDDE